MHRPRIDHTPRAVRRPPRAVPLCALRVRRTAEAAPTRKQEPTALRAGAERGAYGLACRRAEGGKIRGAPCPACHFKAEPLRPTTAARTGPPDPGGRSQARRRPACGHARRTSPPAPDDSAGCRHGFRLASTASRSCARRGPMQHRRSRPTDLSRGAVGSGAHGVQIWACFARRPRMVQLVSALLRRPHAPDRWSTVAPNDGRSRQPAVGVDGRSAHPAGSPQECSCCR